MHDVLRICSDKRQLDHDYEMLLARMNSKDEEDWKHLEFRPRARGFVRKNKATIEVWRYTEYSGRQKTGAVPAFHIRLYVDKELPRGLMRRMMMLWDEIPDYEIRDGALVRV